LLDPRGAGEAARQADDRDRLAELSFQIGNAPGLVFDDRQGLPIEIDLLKLGSHLLYPHTIFR